MEWLDARCSRQARPFLSGLGADLALCLMRTVLMPRVCAKCATPCKLLPVNSSEPDSPRASDTEDRQATKNQQANNRNQRFVEQTKVAGAIQSAACSTGGEPPANGRVAQATVPRICSTSRRTGRRARNRVFLAWLLATGRARLMHGARTGIRPDVHSHCGDLTYFRPHDPAPKCVSCGITRHAVRRLSRAVPSDWG